MKTLDKTTLRVLLRQVRRKLAAEAPDAAARAAERLPLDRLPAFRTFSGYQPTGSEMDPRPLMRRLCETGAAAALPVAERRDAPLAFRVWDPDQALEPDAFGIPAPPPGAAAVLPDLVIAPLLAFDRRGQRLGQGAGHYDRTLANLRAVQSVFVLGLAYSGQEVEELPAEPHDERLDAILTETDYIEVG
ncbi:5-formyltetrahydrofolate cyclo-ligase [Phenylobacterium sp.]|uniref:5-formyltetrahydrofolate cyclo-ligase n=1 Tax=Phenylobacterium sp. TaxID=1871053 RepID=UPI002C8F741D|nr:5-formyltetrahydrofolate cyclo-ligase [Phenylobacterium sp.]HVI32146.1 5-formyltetrahydrofolate cyclo-ligase [Phenylobacterium sp.]